VKLLLLLVTVTMAALEWLAAGIQQLLLALLLCLFQLGFDGSNLSHHRLLQLGLHPCTHAASHTANHWPLLAVP
jgi:hypothetical protein